jgi:hypothetical protein
MRRYFSGGVAIVHGGGGFVSVKSMAANRFFFHFRFDIVLRWLCLFFVTVLWLGFRSNGNGWKMMMMLLSL